MQGKKLIESALKRVLPAAIFAELKHTRARRHSVQVLRNHGVLEISKRVVERCGTTVLRGPFAGLRFPQEVLLDLPCAQRIVGSFEKELHPVFEGLKKGDYEVILNIGSAEGYYAVGLALLLGVPVLAFDVNPEERRRCRKTAELNGVAGLLRMEGYCDGERMRKLVRGKQCFLVSDCEGYELELFDRAAAADLQFSDVLIELHEKQCGGVYESICSAFASSHSIDTYAAAVRDASEYPELEFLGADATRAIEEWRDAGQRWVFLKSRIGRRSFDSGWSENRTVS